MRKITFTEKWGRPVTFDTPLYIVCSGGRSLMRRRLLGIHVRTGEKKTKNKKHRLLGAV